MARITNLLEQVPINASGGGLSNRPITFCSNSSNNSASREDG